MSPPQPEERPYEDVQAFCACNFSKTALEMAVVKLGPAWIYNLYVSEVEMIEARNLLRSLAAQYVDNPLSPYVNVHIDPENKPQEWYVEANGKSFGSIGI